MLKIEEFVTPSPEQWEIVIKGMRNPKNSWDRMDSCAWCDDNYDTGFDLGEKDETLAMSLVAGGPVHAKFRRMLPVFVTINAPLYWWKEFDTYKVGTVANSCSTMHKIHSKEFTLEDFSREYLSGRSLNTLEDIVDELNYWRYEHMLLSHKLQEERSTMSSSEIDAVERARKIAWWQLIQLLPTSYNQKRTVMLNYEVLANMYYWRKNHKLDEWHTFCHWIEELPYSELITGEKE